MTVLLLKLTLCWSFFALLYGLLLRHETFFQANRWYLLGTMLWSIALAAWPAEQIPVPMNGGVPVVEISAFSAGLQQAAAVSDQWQDLDYMWVVYWLGFGLSAARLGWGLIRLSWIIHRGTPEYLADGSCVMQTAATRSPFSFFRWIFVPNLQGSDFQPLNPVNAAMLAHERAHVRGWHSVDVLLGEIACVVFWFHPLAHWYKKALRNVHEYLADAAASRHADIKQYGLLLIGQSQSGMPIAFANHFFQSPLKQRLVMLTKKTSSPVRALKFGLVLPTALFFALLFRQTDAIAQVNNTAATAGAPASKSAEAEPEFPGGVNALMEYLRENIKYPEAAKNAKAEGMVVISFVVLEDGSLTDINEVKTSRTNHQDLVNEAIRVVSMMPKWKPAVQNGKVVKMQFNLPVKFKLDQDPVKELSELDQMPVFPGGDEAMMRFLSSNIQYPAAARKDNVSGLVAVEFVVEKDGSLSSFKPLSSPRSDLTEEAVRVMKLMPVFSPGMKDGMPVRVRFTLPVKFKI